MRVRDSAQNSSHSGQAYESYHMLTLNLLNFGRQRNTHWQVVAKAMSNETNLFNLIEQYSV